MTFKFAISATILVLFSGEIFCQELEHLKEQKPLGYSGNLRLEVNSYATNRAQPRYQPFSWMLYGSPQVALWGINFPFSFIISDQNRSFQQPFNQFGASPNYKWITVHGGYRNVSFSPYTLAGHSFLGGGIELDPKLLRFGAIYGRFLRKTTSDTIIPFLENARYDRYGYAIKLGIGNKANFFDLILMKGEDKATIVGFDPAESPVENAVTGISTTFTLSRKIYFSADFAISAWSENKFNTTEILDKSNYNWFKLFIEPNLSTSFTSAGKAAVGFNSKFTNLRLEYRRIDPGYRSFGSYYFTTDVEAITVAPSFNLFKHKVRLSGSLGLQRNNILNTLNQETLRKIGSINLNLNLTNFNSNINYSNYTFDIEPIYEPIQNDTFRYAQVSENWNGNFTLIRTADKIVNSFTLNSYYQKFTDKSLLAAGVNDNNTLGGSLSYRHNNGKSARGYNLTVHYGQFNSEYAETWRTGAGAGLNRSIFKKKVDLNLQANYFLNFAQSDLASNTLNFNLRSNYKLKDNHTFYVNLFYLKNIAAIDHAGYDEFRGGVGYNWYFRSKQKNTP